MLKTTIKHTAILIFANTPTEEVKRKNIVNGHDLFEHLNNKTYLEAKKTDLDVILYSEELQKGDSFGERFSNAIAYAFSKGYKHIISIGNDSPDLKAKHLTIASENLQQNILTLGPSLDGGTYLIAIAKEQFNKQDFAKLPWQTPKLLASLQNYLKHKDTIVQQLERLKDVDTTTDLHYFLYRFKNSNALLKEIIFTIISSLKRIPFFHFYAYKTQFFTTHYNKGSPFAF